MSRNSLDSRFLLPAFTTRLIRFDDVFFVFFFLLYKEKDKEREKRWLVIGGIAKLFEGNICGGEGNFQGVKCSTSTKLIARHGPFPFAAQGLG